MRKARENQPTEKSWLESEFERLVVSKLSDEELVASMELMRKKRAMDFVCSPGTVSARVQDDEAGRSFQVVMSVQEFSPEVWSHFVSAMATEALPLALLLAGELPSEVAHVSGYSLLPTQDQEFSLACECKKKSGFCKHRGALVFRLIEACDEDSFTIFLLRGRGKDELLFQLTRERAAITGGSAELGAVSVPTDSTEEPRTTSREQLWEPGKELWNLQFSLRADELPASLFKRLETIPLGDIENAAEMAFEEAYLQVATRAQAFALDLLRTPLKM